MIRLMCCRLFLRLSSTLLLLLLLPLTRLWNAAAAPFDHVTVLQHNKISNSMLPGTTHASWP